MLPTNRYYKVRYGNLPVKDIFNFVGPANRGFNLPEDELAALVARRIEKNLDFYVNLEESIKNEGIRNPILVHSGWIKERKWYHCPGYIKIKKMENVLICVSIGGSRLFIAERLNLKDIPCIILDHNDRFTHLEELTTEDEISAKFINKPTSIICNRQEIEIRMPRQLI